MRQTARHLRERFSRQNIRVLTTNHQQRDVACRFKQRPEIGCRRTAGNTQRDGRIVVEDRGGIFLHIEAARHRQPIFVVVLGKCDVIDARRLLGGGVPISNRFGLANVTRNALDAARIDFRADIVQHGGADSFPIGGHHDDRHQSAE